MPKIPDNAEKSAFIKGAYIVYDKRGNIWHARHGANKTWVCRPGPSNPALAVGAIIRGKSLAAVAARVAERYSEPAPAADSAAAPTKPDEVTP